MSLRHDRMDLLRLTLVPGIGPVLLRRLLDVFADPNAIFAAAPDRLANVPGIGPARAAAIVESRESSLTALDNELALAERAGVQIIACTDPEYPPLLAELADAPPLIYVRGDVSILSSTYTVAIVGSRRATHYGLEQAERFASMLAESGLTIVSGGARGIDTAAHRAAIRVRGKTIAVLGCGLSHCYPPENAELFDKIASSGGAVISELPMSTSPSPENFPARNRIISGMSLGVLVSEAPGASGALITARLAAEEHGRDVFAIPGRLDSRSSEGTNDLIKCGSAQLVTHPGDILEALEPRARHYHDGTHASRYADPSRSQGSSSTIEHSGNGRSPRPGAQTAPLSLASLSDRQKQVVAALTEPRTIDEIAREASLDVAAVASEVTVLEIRHVVRRQGSRIALCGS